MSFRIVYALQIDDDIRAIPAFQGKSKSGIKTPKQELDPLDECLKHRWDMPKMEDDATIIRGSGNVLRDAGREQLRTLLAAKIIGVIDDRKLTVRAAQQITGVDASDFSRIRKASLDRFTIDRLMTILSGLGQEVEVSVDVYPRRTHPAPKLQP